jgi:aldehyde dehydrogenase (NAD+)
VQFGGIVLACGAGLGNEINFEKTRWRRCGGHYQNLGGFMLDKTEFYINGSWVPSQDGHSFPVLNPATEDAFATITLGGAKDAEAAIAAAKAAFPAWSMTSPADRAGYLQKLLDVYIARNDEMGATISTEMGAPIDMAVSDQAGSGISHLKAFIRALGTMEFQRPLRQGVEGQDIAFEAAGVAALITPWNWPMNQVVLKVGAALAAGCTMVLKPSEIAPMSSILFAEMIDEAGFPAGVFNMVNGDGAGVGTILSSHPDIDVVSFTGSTRAGILISKAAADTVKTVSLELGGKSPNLVFDDCDVDKAVRMGAAFVSIIQANLVMRQLACWFSEASMIRLLKSPQPKPMPPRLICRQIREITSGLWYLKHNSTRCKA